MNTSPTFRHYVVTRKHPTILRAYRRACLCGWHSPWQRGGPPPVHPHLTTIP